MKKLILNSAKIAKSFYPITNLNSSIPLVTYRFATTKPKQSRKVKDKTVPNCDVDHQKLDHQISSKKSAQKQLINSLNSYISMDDLKVQPGALKSLLLNIVNVLEYQKDNNKGRQFFLQHKQNLEKFFFDVRSYNAENFMTNEEIMLVFYLKKIFRDFGISQPPIGFELRAGIKLAHQIQIKQDGSVSNPLTLDEAISIYWLMSRLDISNHEYKWNCVSMIHSIMGKWKKSSSFQMIESSSRNPPTKKWSQISQLPIKFHHLAALISSFYNQSVHMNSDYQMISTLSNILLENHQQYCSYEQLMKNQNMFLEMFACVIALEQYQQTGQSNYQFRQIFHYMVAAIEKRLMSVLTTDQAIVKSFVEAKNISEFLSKGTFLPFSAYSQKDEKQNLTIPNFTEEDSCRYFIFLNEIHENQNWFLQFSRTKYGKIRFALIEILDRYFLPKLHKKNVPISQQQLSIITRTWIKKAQLSLDKLHPRNQKTILEKQQIPRSDILQKISKQFSQLLQIFTEQIKLQIRQIQGSELGKSKKKSYLTAKQKQIEEQKNIFLKNIETNLVKPLIDFIFSNGKIHITSKQHLTSFKIIMIDRFQTFVTEIFGDQISNDQNQNQITTLSIENKYFWMLKLMRIQWSKVPENKIFLKEFQNLLLEIVVKNNMKKKPESYHEVSIYNLFAYMCKLQEKMMENDIKNTNEVLELQIESFEKKNEYKYFLAYKSYLAKLIFSKDIEENSTQSQQSSSANKDTDIPKQLRINKLFVKTQQKNQILKQKSFKDKKTSSKQQQNNNFNLYKFFTIIFNQNRYYNHKLLSQQVLLYLFGTQDIMKENVMQFIQKQNQRNVQNFNQLIYMILLASDSESNVKTIHHSISLKQIKRTLFQQMTQKSKGSMIINVLRDIIAPRKSSFLKPAPLKYRQKPYSIFETVCNQSTQRKKQILLTLLDLYHPSDSLLFGLLQVILLNTNVWGQSRTEIVTQVIMPLFMTRMKKGQQNMDGFRKHFLQTLLRMIRLEIVNVTPNNQTVYLQMIDYILPPLFENVPRVTKVIWKFQALMGYLLDIQKLIQNGNFTAKNMLPLLQKCHANILKDGEVNIKDKNDDNRLFFGVYGVFQQCLTVCQNPKNHKYSEIREKSNTYEPKIGSWLPKKPIEQSTQSQQKQANQKSSQGSSSLFKKSPKPQSSQKDQSVKKGFLSKSRTNLSDYSK